MGWRGQGNHSLLWLKEHRLEKEKGRSWVKGMVHNLEKGMEHRLGKGMEHSLEKEMEHSLEKEMVHRLEKEMEHNLEKEMVHMCLMGLVQGHKLLKVHSQVEVHFHQGWKWRCLELMAFVAS